MESLNIQLSSYIEACIAATLDSWRGCQLWLPRLSSHPGFEASGSLRVQVYLIYIKLKNMDIYSIYIFTRYPCIKYQFQLLSNGDHFNSSRSSFSDIHCSSTTTMTVFFCFTTISSCRMNFSCKEVVPCNLLYTIYSRDDWNCRYLQMLYDSHVLLATH